MYHQCITSLNYNVRYILIHGMSPRTALSYKGHSPSLMVMLLVVLTKRSDWSGLVDEYCSRMSVFQRQILLELARSLLDYVIKLFQVFVHKELVSLLGNLQ
jgi:hypothetical protein